MSIEAMKQALEALEYCKHLAECQRVWGGTEWSYPFPWKRIFDSTTKSLHTIRTAIEQAEKQEPVAWMVYTLDGKSVCVTDNPQDFSDKNRVLPLYTDPPAAQREWVGLTDEDRTELWWNTDMSGMPEHDYGKAIEAKLKEKNT